METQPEAQGIAAGTHLGFTDFGDGGFLQILYHCHKHLIACNLSKVYPEGKKADKASSNYIEQPFLKQGLKGSWG